MTSEGEFERQCSGITPNGASCGNTPSCKQNGQWWCSACHIKMREGMAKQAGSNSGHLQSILDILKNAKAQNVKLAMTKQKADEAAAKREKSGNTDETDAKVMSVEVAEMQSAFDREPLVQEEPGAMG